LLYCVWYSVRANGSQPRMILGLYVECIPTFRLVQLHADGVTPRKTTIISEAQECSYEVYSHAGLFPFDTNL
jgi:hypothetical protein